MALVDVQFTPEELGQIQSAINDYRLTRSNLETFRARISELIDHPNRVHLALQSTWRAALARDMHNIGTGLANPQIGVDRAARHFEEKGIVGGLADIGYQALMTPIHAIADVGESVATGQPLESPIGTAVGLTSLLPAAQLGTAAARMGLAIPRATRRLAKRIPEATGVYRDIGRGFQVAGVVEGAKEWPLEAIGDIGMDVGIGFGQRVARRMIDGPQPRLHPPPEDSPLTPPSQVEPARHAAAPPQPQPLPIEREARMRHRMPQPQPFTTPEDTQARLDEVRQNFPRWSAISQEFQSELDAQPATNVPLNLLFRNFADRRNIPQEERSRLYDFVRRDVEATENERNFEQSVAQGFVRWQSTNTANLPTRILWTQYADAHGVPQERRESIWQRIERSITGQHDLNRRQAPGFRGEPTVEAEPETSDDGTPPDGTPPPAAGSAPASDPAATPETPPEPSPASSSPETQIPIAEGLNADRPKRPPWPGATRTDRERNRDATAAFGERIVGLLLMKNAGAADSLPGLIQFIHNRGGIIEAEVDAFIAENRLEEAQRRWIIPEVYERLETTYNDEMRAAQQPAAAPPQPSATPETQQPETQPVQAAEPAPAQPTEPETEGDYTPKTEEELRAKAQRFWSVYRGAVENYSEEEADSAPEVQQAWDDAVHDLNEADAEVLNEMVFALSDPEGYAESQAQEEQRAAAMATWGTPPSEFSFGKKETFRSPTDDGSLDIEGYPFEFGGMRFMVHKPVDGEGKPAKSGWKVSEFVSGRSLMQQTYNTRNDAAAGLVEFINQRGESVDQFIELIRGAVEKTAEMNTDWTANGPVPTPRPQPTPQPAPETTPQTPQEPSQPVQEGVDTQEPQTSPPAASATPSAEPEQPAPTDRGEQIQAFATQFVEEYGPFEHETDVRQKFTRWINEHRAEVPAEMDVELFRLSNQLASHTFTQVEPEGEVEVTAEAARPYEPPEEENRVRRIKDKAISQEVVYGVVDLAQLITSHLLGRGANPIYDQSFQPRDDRGGGPQEDMVRENARELDGELLIDHQQNPNLGAPTVAVAPLLDPETGKIKIGEDGKPVMGILVISGNGRVMSIREATENYPDRYAEYRELLEDGIGQYGIPESELQGKQYPVLVRFVRQPVSKDALTTIARRATVNTGQAMNQATQARMDSNALLQDQVFTLMNLNTDKTMEEALELKENEPWVKAFIEAMPPEERTAMYDPTTRDPNETAHERIEEALLGAIFSGADGKWLVSRMLTSNKEHIKRMAEGVNRALPALAMLELGIQKGLYDPKLSVAEDIAAAIRARERITRRKDRIQGKTKRYTVEEWRRQIDFASSDIVLTAAADLILDIADNATRENYGRSLMELIRTYAADSVTSLPRSQGELAFGDDSAATGVLDKEERLRMIVDRLKAAKAAQNKAGVSERLTDMEGTQQQRRQPELDLGGTQQQQQRDTIEVLDEQVDHLVQDATPNNIKRKIRGFYARIKTGRGAKLVGNKIDSPYLAAVTAQVYRHPSMESSRLFFVDDNDRIVDHTGVSAGQFSATQELIFSEIKAHMARLRKAGKTVTGVIALHNHGYGDARLSPQDLKNAVMLRNTLGSEFLGSLAINSGTYSSLWYGRDANLKGGDYKRTNLGQLRPEDVGWDTTSPMMNQGWVREADPLFHERSPQHTQHLVSGLQGAEMASPEAQAQGREAAQMFGVNYPGWGRFVAANQGRTIEESEMMSHFYDPMEQVALRAGTILKTTRNWVTLLFTTVEGNVTAIVDYQNLHLAPEGVLGYIENQAKLFAGEQVHVYIGEGDWYSDLRSLREAGFDRTKMALDTAIASVYAEGLPRPTNKLIWDGVSVTRFGRSFQWKGDDDMQMNRRQRIVIERGQVQGARLPQQLRTIDAEIDKFLTDRKYQRLLGLGHAQILDIMRGANREDLDRAVAGADLGNAAERLRSELANVVNRQRQNVQTLEQVVESSNRLLAEANVMEGQLRRNHMMRSNEGRTRLRTMQREIARLNEEVGRIHQAQDGIDYETEQLDLFTDVLGEQYRNEQIEGLRREQETASRHAVNAAKRLKKIMNQVRRAIRRGTDTHSAYLERIHAARPETEQTGELLLIGHEAASESSAILRQAAQGGAELRDQVSLLEQYNADLRSLLTDFHEIEDQVENEPHNLDPDRVMGLRRRLRNQIGRVNVEMEDMRGLVREYPDPDMPDRIQQTVQDALNQHNLGNALADRARYAGVRYDTMDTTMRAMNDHLHALHQAAARGNYLEQVDARNTVQRDITRLRNDMRTLEGRLPAPRDERAEARARSLISLANEIRTNLANAINSQQSSTWRRRLAEDMDDLDEANSQIQQTMYQIEHGQGYPDAVSMATAQTNIERMIRQAQRDLARANQSSAGATAAPRSAPETPQEVLVRAEETSREMERAMELAPTNDDTVLNIVGNRRTELDRATSNLRISIRNNINLEGATDWVRNELAASRENLQWAYHNFPQIQRPSEQQTATPASPGRLTQEAIDIIESEVGNTGTGPMVSEAGSIRTEEERAEAETEDSLDDLLADMDELINRSEQLSGRANVVRSRVMSSIGDVMFTKPESRNYTAVGLTPGVIPLTSKLGYTRVTANLRDWWKNARTEISSGLKNLDRFGEKLGAELKELFYSVVDMRMRGAAHDKYAIQQMIKNELQSIVDERAKTVTGMSKEKIRANFDQQIWRYIEENIEPEEAIRGIAVQVKERWRGIVKNRIRFMIDLRRALMEEEGEELNIYDSRGKKYPWTPLMPDMRWDDEGQVFVDKAGNRLTIEQALDNAQKIWMPHYYPHDEWLNLGAEANARRESLRRLLDPKYLSENQIPGFTYGEASKRWKHNATGQTFDNRTEAITFELTRLNERWHFADNEIEAVQAGILGRWGHMERVRETKDPNYMRSLDIIIDDIDSFWSRFSDIVHYGQHDPVSARAGGYPRLQMFIDAAGEYAENERERVLKIFTDHLQRYDMFEKVGSFRLGRRRESNNMFIMENWRQIDIQRMRDDPDSLVTDDVLASWEGIGLVTKDADGSYKIADNYVVAKLLGEYMEKVQRNKAIVVNIAKGLSGWDNSKPLELPSERFWNSINTLTTIRTLGVRSSVRNVAEIPLMAMVSGSKAVAQGLKAMATDPDARQFGEKLGAAMQQAVEYLAQGALQNQYLKWVRFPQSEQLARTTGAVIGMFAARDAITNYVNDQTRNNAERLRELHIDVGVIDNYIQNGRGDVSLEQIYSESKDRLMRGELQFAGLRPADAPPPTNPYVDIVGDQIAGSMRYQSELIFKEYNELSLPNRLAGKDGATRLFFKYKAWGAQMHRAVWAQIRYAKKEARRGNWAPAWRMAQSMAWMGGSTMAVSWVFALIASRDYDDPLFRGFVESQTLGALSQAIELAARSGGNPFTGYKNMLSELSPPTIDVLASAGGKILGGDAGGLGEEAFKAVPFGKDAWWLTTRPRDAIMAQPEDVAGQQ